ncbi:MAG TPA: WD40 repeat domain-containing protein [Phototrophicaceae bacterium]|nr:WD40 repeat domain-containing protein [Phototrophicaceae bacterium]
MLFCLIGVGAALTAHAQQDQPITQPTVDAAVATLIAQTQQAPAHLGATQTIQAALNHALTATRMALITPTPTPQTFDASHLSVQSVNEVDLTAGPAGTDAYFAPDGTKFAYLSQKTLCVYEGQTQGNCVDISQAPGVDSESVRWSPDSRYVVFAQDFFRYFRDSDIWVWDTTTNQLNDLTSSSTGPVNFLTSKDWTGVDVTPRWLPNGQILFLRYSSQGGTILPPDIDTIAPDGSDLQKLGNLAVSDHFAVYALDVSATQVVYNYFALADSPMNGLWISDLNGNNARQLLHTDHGVQIAGVQLSPDGKFVLINPLDQNAIGHVNPQDSLMSLVDVATGKSFLIDPDRYVTAAGWSPKGSALIYVTHDAQQPDNDSVFLTNTPGTAGQPLAGLQGRLNLPTSRLEQSLTWGANNTILISHSPDQGIVLLHLGS